MWSRFPSGNLGSSKGLLDHTSVATPAPSSLPFCPRYLGQAGSEENTFKEFPHPSQELIHIRPLEHIHLRKDREACWRQPREGEASQHRSLSSLTQKASSSFRPYSAQPPTLQLPGRPGWKPSAPQTGALALPPHRASSGSVVPASTQLGKKCMHLCPGANAVSDGELAAASGNK